MTSVRVNGFSVSLDGFGAGPYQDQKNPLGVGGERLHEWMVPTLAFRKTHGQDKGTTGPDNDFAARVSENIGAWVMGRNMFGPLRGTWPDDRWKVWWGDDPPFHTDVFVLTHHARDPIEMAGGTTFRFVTDGIQSALARRK